MGGVGRDGGGLERDHPEKEKTLQAEQTVAQIANEVLLRQAKARAERNGEPI